MSHQHLSSVWRVEVLGDLDSEALLEARDHADTAPGGGEVNLNGVRIRAIAVVLDLVAPLLEWLPSLLSIQMPTLQQMLSEVARARLDLQHHLGDEVLSHVKEVMVVRVGLVELHRGELRVVCHVNTLIPAGQRCARSL